MSSSRLLRRDDHCQAVPPLRAAALQDVPSPGCRHSRSKPVRSLATNIAWLVGAPHCAHRLESAMSPQMVGLVNFHLAGSPPRKPTSARRFGCRASGSLRCTGWSTFTSPSRFRLRVNALEMLRAERTPVYRLAATRGVTAAIARLGELAASPRPVMPIAITLSTHVLGTTFELASALRAHVGSPVRQPPKAASC
jgi:hypothetical protein